MQYPIPDLRHRDDVEPSSAAGVVEMTYDAANRPSRRLREQVAPIADPLADDPGSNPHAMADEVATESPDRPAEDYEGIQSRRGRVALKKKRGKTRIARKAGRK